MVCIWLKNCRNSKFHHTISLQLVSSPQPRNLEFNLESQYFHNWRSRKIEKFEKNTLPLILKKGPRPSSRQIWILFVCLRNFSVLHQLETLGLLFWNFKIKNLTQAKILGKNDLVSALANIKFKLKANLKNFRLSLMRDVHWVRAQLKCFFWVLNSQVWLKAKC